ncbi:MAG: aminodeoxychorismate lyase [Woeseiaceae bacterium]
MTHWFDGGRPLDSIRVDDRAVQYGDGLFETIAIRGGRARLWNYHVERLQTGCARLGLSVPNAQQLEDTLSAALVNGPVDTEYCVAKLLVSAGTGARGYRRPDESPGTLLVGLSEAQPLPAEWYRDGVRVRVCDTRLAIQPQLAGIKTLNRLEQVLARNEWDDETAFEGLLLDADERLICGTMSNVFLIDGNSLVTPAITRCGVAGVMRRHVLATVAQAGIDCEVRDLSCTELNSCQGGFLTNSQFGVLPVMKCENRAWRQDGFSRQFMRLVADSGVAEYPA